VLPTFVIGLREGIEASLIVGIIAAFLQQRGHGRQLRWVWAGTGVAVALCAGVAVLLDIVNRDLPERSQDRLETIISLVAVAMVTSMIVWMAHHARHLRGDLEARAASALLGGSAIALGVMAFLAVLREGMETAVFLLAAFQASTNRAASSAGAALGILVAVGVGWLIYRGGVRINLARFFRMTGLVLVVVAAGLVSFALHTAHEAGWMAAGQHQLMNLRWLVKPGSVRSALLTGMLGIRAKPTVIEAIGWLAYAVPMTLFVARSSRRPLAPRQTMPVTATTA